MDYSTTKKYMDILRERYNGCSNYRIAQLLKVSKSCVSHWSNGKNGMGDDAAARLADLCELDPVEVITELYIERSKSDATRHYFEEVLKRTGTCALLMIPSLYLFIQTQLNGSLFI